MNIRVVYHSGYKGNTKKVADAIAENFDVSAERVGKDKVEFAEPVDLLFIGSGVYFDKPHKKVSAFINEVNAAIIKNSAVFGTYGNQSNIGEQLKTLVKEHGINVLGEPFVCKGASVGTDNKGHPNGEDLEHAKAFAETIASMI